MAEDEVPHYRNAPVKPRWLERHVEEPIDPALPIVDAHHHLYDFAHEPYDRRDFLADVGGHNVVAAVYVQCFCGYRSDGPEAMRPVGETEYAAAIARESEAAGDRPVVPTAIVGFADMMLGDRVRPVLEAHVEAGGGRFRGIRMTAARDPHIRSQFYAPPPADMMEDAAYRAGLASLRDLGLSYDIMLFHHQLDGLARLADALPDLPIVLNHTGNALGFGPYAQKRAEIFEIWSRGVRLLAERPNVYMKLGGMGMAMWGFDFHARPMPPSSTELADAFRPYVETCIETLGADRCMFESNFPADKGSCSYGTLWNAFKRLSAGASRSERSALFHDTAAAVYELQTRGSGKIRQVPQPPA